MADRRKIITFVFYIGVTVVLAGILVELWPLVLPKSLATKIGHNSEGMLAALMIGPWIQLARPRLLDSRHRWPIAAIVAAASLAIGLGLVASDLPSRFRTLNETFLAAAVVLPYLLLRRPLPAAVPLVGAGTVLAVTVAFNHTAVITDLAETLGMLILAPIGFDLIDRKILRPDAAVRAVTLVAWYALLVGAPIALSVLQYDIGFGGLFGQFTRYGVRIAESFLFMLLIGVYFAALRAWAGREADTPVAEPVPVG
jgi:hypothetical protein